ncbi:MAG: hypothetical protein IPP35_04095 [Elusimicrobia bacterium]|nr:hypothetical protein [Elusimicrobiota bacterium]
MVPLLFSQMRRSTRRVFSGAALLFLLPWLAAHAEPRLSDLSAEDELKGEFASPAPDSTSLFEFSQEGWNQARETVEAAERSAPPAPRLPVAAGEPLTGISVDLPYDSGLSISGRKLIAFKMAQIRRKSGNSGVNNGLAQNQNDVEMRQELQVRIKGKVGRKITVNVDFDDTKEDKKDISVVYQGDPGEFVQEAAFGDITLSLPSTEFVSFSKQLFGVRTKLQYKNASLLAIGSRTKGTTETRRFNGATKFERRIIKDVDFVKQQYYAVAFTTKTILAGSEAVWRDDNILTNNNTVTISTDVEDTDVVSNYSGNFDRLKPGDDYTMDAARGILFFRRRVDDRAVIAINYKFTDGTQLSDLNTPGRLKVIKTDSNKPLTTPLDPLETAYRREIETFYSLGNIKIVHDNDLGNFILRTIDGNQNDLGVLLTSDELLQYKPTIEVDFDLGIFNVDFSTGPFDPAGYLRVKDPQLYEPSPTTKFSFLTEYRYRLRDFQLRPNIVYGSERVTVNGRLMKSEIDYFIDPASGLLQFFNEDELNETSQIEVTYDYAPFGGQLGQTLVGGRAELAVIPGRFQLGSSFLYTFAPKTTVVPDVRSTPSSLMVLEADGRLTEVNVPFLPVKLSLTGEVAQSREDPNLYGKALVDSMEGLAQEDAAVMDQDLWPLGANPDAYGVPTSSSSLVVSEAVSVKLKDVVSPGANVSESENLRVLPIAFKLDRKPGGAPAPEEASILQALSKTGGRDFSKKKYLEMWLEGFGPAGAGVDLLVSAGSLNEDSDLDGIPDTEDRGPNPDGTLNEGEDVGYDFNGWGPDGASGGGDDVSFQIGAGNGRLDAEDANGGGFLTADVGSPVTPLAQLSALPAGTTVTKQDGTTDSISDLGFQGWRFIRVPLNAIISNPEGFSNVQHLRLTFRGAAGGGAKSSTVRIGKIAFVGTTWETPTVSPGAFMEIAAVNNLDNPNYQTLIGNPAYNELYGDQAENRTREQALQLKFTLPIASSATTRSVYGSARDFSHHRNFNFFFQTPTGQQTGEHLFIQMGTETDYFEFERPVNSVGGWTLETLNLVDLNNDGTPDTLQSTTVNSTVTVVGAPSLTRLGQIKIGVRNRTLTPITSELWVNEIYLSGSRTRVGNARRFAADASWNGWGTFGGIFRNVDRNFQTLTSPVVNQDRQELSGYANLTRFRFAPLTGSFYKNQTITPTALQTGQSQLVSVLSEGREDNAHVRGDGQFLFPKFPALAYSAERTVTESTDRQERRDRNLYTGSLDYAVPGRVDVMPGKYTFRPLPESVFVKYSRSNYFLSYFPEKKEQQIAASTDPVSQRNAIFSNAQTAEAADDWTGRLTFTPWVGLSLTPTYSQRRVTEQREFSESDLAAVPDFSSAQAYEKSFSQSRGLAGSWKIFSWLEPRLTYTRSGTETNGLPTSSSPTAAGLKTLDRSSNGDLFLNIAPAGHLSQPQIGAFPEPGRQFPGGFLRYLRRGFERLQGLAPHHSVPAQQSPAQGRQFHVRALGPAEF